MDHRVELSEEALVDKDSPTISPTHTFLAIMRRDLYVTGREFPVFLAQVALQPLFLLFVFGKVLTQLGYTRHGYSDLLFPGILALTAVITGVQGTALPLVIEFSFSKEIEDRLLAPIATWAVAGEKVVFAALRSLVAALVMFPMGYLILGNLPVDPERFGEVMGFLVLGSLLGAAMGLTLGTLVNPNRINIVFALVLTPLLFTGCSQYPWPSLRAIPWFQALTTLNPLTYLSEASRAILTPAVPHMSLWVCGPMLAIFTLGFLALGIRGFLRRAMD